MLEAVPERVTIRSINSARSACLAITFRHSFFDSFQVFEESVVQASFLSKVRAQGPAHPLAPCRAILQPAAHAAPLGPRYLHQAWDTHKLVVHVGHAAPPRPTTLQAISVCCTCTWPLTQQQLAPPPWLLTRTPAAAAPQNIIAAFRSYKIGRMTWEISTSDARLQVAVNCENGEPAVTQAWVGLHVWVVLQV
jgi:hypothetical protein